MFQRMALSQAAPAIQNALFPLTIIFGVLRKNAWDKPLINCGPVTRSCESTARLL